MESNIPTPHISAQKNSFAKTVLMPGDPIRSKYIVDTYLTSAVLVNNIRGVQGYTGKYKNIEVSVMASGMGNPSMGIYAHELFNFYNVENIIRIGSAGGLQPHGKVKDIVVAIGCSTNSNYINAGTSLNSFTFAPIASWKLLKAAHKIQDNLGMSNVKFGSIGSHDTFYHNSEKRTEWAKMGILASEMESVALYTEAAKSNKNALSIVTISDSGVTGESLSIEERETSFKEMMELALNLACEIS